LYRIKQSADSRILKLPQWLGAVPQIPAFVNIILVLKPHFKNPGYALGTGTQMMLLG